LSELGYGLDFTHDALTQEAIRSDSLYRCDIHAGFSLCAAGATTPMVFDGSCLLAIAAGDYSAAATRQSAKRLARIQLQPLLGARPLKSRELFLAVKA
jgi:DNA repair protein RecO (recombination protein O)